MKKLSISVMILFLLVGGWIVWGMTHSTSPVPVKSSAQHEKEAAKQPNYVDAVLSKMTLHEKVASLLIANTPGIDPQGLGGFMDTYKLGGFILMGENIPASDTALQGETAALRGKDKKLPRLVATDQEGGTVRRLMGDNYANALTLKNLPVVATKNAFAARSSLVQSVGITLNFGIVADVTADPNSFIYPRVLGTSPRTVAERVVAAVTASEDKTLSTIKHFPGHGETEADSHASIPTTSLSFADWQARDESPFKAGIGAGADLVMAGHLRYSAVDNQPASLSKKWHRILRDDLNFKGVVITDAMGMLQNSGEAAYADPVKNAVVALGAGNTMLLYVFDDTNRLDPNILVDGIVTAIKQGKLDEKLVTADARAALQLRAHSAALVRQ